MGAPDRKPLVNLDVAPVEVCRPLLAEDVQGAEVVMPVFSIGREKGTTAG